MQVRGMNSTTIISINFNGWIEGFQSCHYITGNTGRLASGQNRKSVTESLFETVAAYAKYGKDV